MMVMLMNSLKKPEESSRGLWTERRAPLWAKQARRRG